MKTKVRECQEGCWDLLSPAVSPRGRTHERSNPKVNESWRIFPQFCILATPWVNFVRGKGFAERNNPSWKRRDRRAEPRKPAQ
ncbi:hypothetical protein AFLA_008517 [Aspergillus flavus NRRL3357]|nr:hypothetical protein AFLA_008517 [Aspergillus flavus NRRL3357]